MTRYEELESSVYAEDVTIHDVNFGSDRIKGLYYDGSVAISSSISTDAERACVLAEELGHHHTSSGVILDLSSTANRKQELVARLWAYDRLIGLEGIVSGYKAGCRSRYELADHLGVTEEFLQEALLTYQAKYGTATLYEGYVIYFEPALGVLEISKGDFYEVSKLWKRKY